MLPVSPFKMFHCSVRSRTVFKLSFWMQAAVAKGWGSTPMAVGSSFSTEATSAASDLYSMVTSEAESPFSARR